jgi:hypothetical protein
MVTAVRCTARRSGSTVVTRVWKAWLSFSQETAPNHRPLSSIITKMVLLAKSQNPRPFVESGRIKSAVPGGAGQFANSIKSGQEPECGHENALLSSRAIYVLGQLHLGLLVGAGGGRGDKGPGGELVSPLGTSAGARACVDFARNDYGTHPAVLGTRFPE